MSLFQNPVQIIIQRRVSPNGKITVSYPVIIGMMNQQVQQILNYRITALINNLVNSQINEYLQSGYTIDDITADVFTEIKNNQRGILSIAVHAYFFPYPAAHGITIIHSATYDTNTGRQYMLSEVFKPGSDYVKVLSDKIGEQIKQREIPLINEYKGIKPEQYFYIADKTIVIYFQLYDLTPYVYGFPMFPISLYDIQELIPEDGILSSLIINQ